MKGKFCNIYPLQWARGESLSTHNSTYDVQRKRKRKRKAKRQCKDLMLLWRWRQCPFAKGSVLTVITSAYIAGTNGYSNGIVPMLRALELVQGSEGEAGVEPGMKVMRAGRITSWSKEGGDRQVHW
jgi:hypothetical protein